MANQHNFFQSGNYQSNQKEAICSIISSKHAVMRLMTDAYLFVYIYTTYHSLISSSFYLEFFLNPHFRH